MTTSGLLDARAVREQPVQPRDADVEEALDPVAGELGGQRGLLGHRDVGGSGADHGDRPAPAVGRGRRPDDDRARHRQVARRRHGGEDRGGRRGADARRERGRARPSPSSVRIAGDLLGRLALAEHDLGEAGAQVPVGVDAGEAEGRGTAARAARSAHRRSEALRPRTASRSARRRSGSMLGRAMPQEH